MRTLVIAHWHVEPCCSLSTSFRQSLSCQTDVVRKKLANVSISGYKLTGLASACSGVLPFIAELAYLSCAASWIERTTVPSPRCVDGDACVWTCSYIQWDSRRVLTAALRHLDPVCLLALPRAASCRAGVTDPLLISILGWLYARSRGGANGGYWKQTYIYYNLIIICRVEYPSAKMGIRYEDGEALNV